MEDLLYVEDEYEYYTESEVEADGEEEEDDDDETIKNVPIRSVCCRGPNFLSSSAPSLFCHVGLVRVFPEHILSDSFDTQNT